MHKILFISFSFLLIAGCANTGNSNVRSSMAASPQKIVTACMSVTHARSITLVEVPAAHNALSNKMAALTIKMGGSNTVDALVQILSQPVPPTIAVYGSSDELAAATLEAALNKLPASTQPSGQPICFIGDVRYEATLKPAAERAGLVLFTVSRS